MKPRNVVFIGLVAGLGVIGAWIYGGQGLADSQALTYESNRAGEGPSDKSVATAQPKRSTSAETIASDTAGVATRSVNPGQTKRIEPSPLSRRLFASVSELGQIYRELKSRESTLSGDEWLALRDVILGCMALASTEEQMKLVPARAALVSSNPQRSKAADTSRRACAEIPESELTDKRLSAIFGELNRREHPIVQAETLRAMTESGFGAVSHDRATALLSSPDPVIMMRVADYLAYEIRLTGMYPEFLARGLNTEHLSDGWQLAVCDLTGGCGSDSQQLIGPCVIMNRCDVASLAEYMRKYEPEKFASADQFRQLVLASYKSGDWSWLNLPTLRTKLPA